MIAYRKSQQGKLNTDKAGNVCVAGIGGAGCNVLDRMALEGMPNADLVAVNCDVRALQNSMCPRQIQLGAQLTRGLGTGGDPELGREAAVSSETELRELFENRDMVFICAGLGGGTGSGATPHLVKTARDCGAFVVVFATMPFSFEGRRRLSQAIEALEELRRLADVLIVFENDRMGELALNKQGIQQAFAAADTIISQSIRSIHTLVRQPGLIQIGMDDLMSALRNDDARCLFGYGDAKGENRAHEALKRALKSPLLHQNELLEQTATILVHIAGGEDLTLFEVELLMRELGKQVPDNAHILFGTAIDPKLGDLLSVSLISSISANPAASEPVEAPADETIAASHAGATTEEDPDADADTRINATAPPAAEAASPAGGDTIDPDDQPQAGSPQPPTPPEVQPPAREADAAEPDPAPGAAVSTPSPAATPKPQPQAETMELLGLDDPPAPADAESRQPGHEPATAQAEDDSPPPKPAAAESTAAVPTPSEPVPSTHPGPATASTANDPAPPASLALKSLVSIKPAHSGPVPVNSLAGVGSSGTQGTARSFDPSPAPSRAPSATPFGRRLPDFGSPLTQSAPALPREPKVSLLKSLANGSVPLEKTVSGPLAAPPTQATPPAKANPPVPPPLESSAPEALDQPPARDDFDHETPVNPIAAAMLQAKAAKAPSDPPGHQHMPPVDQHDHRDFGRPEAEHGTIEPFPQPAPEQQRQRSKVAASGGARRPATPEQPMLDLEPATKGRFDRGEPNIVDGEDLDVPAFLRRSR